MYQRFSYTNQLTFFQKLRSIDYILLLCILIIGSISIFAMYSTDGGEILYHTKNHIIRFLISFLILIMLSFVNIRFWFSTGYIFYSIALVLLIWASFYGITASGSQRWISLYFINFQPSELMKIAIIICFAKYYHRMQLGKVNKFINLLIPLIILFFPIALVASQPDLGLSLIHI